MVGAKPKRALEFSKMISHENHGYQMLFGIGTLISVSYDEFRRTKKGHPRGGLMTKRSCPPCLGEVLRRGFIVE